MIRRSICCVMAVGLLTLLVSPAHAADVANCPARPTAVGVFVGVLQSRDDITATFRVVQVRAGSLEGYATNTTNTLVDIRYGNDVKFLSVGESYLVGAGTDAATLVLSSSVRKSEALFGGNEVAGVDNGAKNCPRLEDPVRTLHIDGSSIDSGIFTSFFSRTGALAVAIIAPALLFLGLLIALVLGRRAIRQ